MVEKVIRAARALSLDIEVKRLERPTRTVAEAAAAVGADPAAIAKSLVFVSDGDPILAVVSGAHRADMDLLADAFDCAEVRQASPDEVRAATGFAVGGVPPVGHDLPVVFDEALCDHELIWAAGGDGNTLFSVDPKALARAIDARIVSVGAAPA
ncbi:MAG TPA: YbaK/EbsC family protein [Thermoleophilaceae bacterium]|jgi:prolyl-tRNA editing enzyme YbaK/EbsC (Cys-tRNA(Pro) deacylase)